MFTILSTQKHINVKDCGTTDISQTPQQNHALTSKTRTHEPTVECTTDACTKYSQTDTEFMIALQSAALQHSSQSTTLTANCTKQQQGSQHDKVKNFRTNFLQNIRTI